MTAFKLLCQYMKEQKGLTLEMLSEELAISVDLAGKWNKTGYKIGSRIPNDIQNILFQKDCLLRMDFLRYIKAFGVSVPEELCKQRGMTDEEYIKLFGYFFREFLKSEIREKNNEKRTEEAEIKTWAELSDIGYSSLDVIHELHANDESLYNIKRGDPNWGEDEVWAEFLESYQDSFRFLVLNERIIGNYSMVTLGKEQLSLIEKGELLESTFSIRNNDVLNIPGNYTLFLLNLSVNLRWNNVVNLNKLLNSFWDQMVTYAENGIFFDKIFVNVFRDSHEKIYQKIGFIKHVVDGKPVESKGTLYIMEDFPNRVNWQHKEKLQELYRKRNGTHHS